MCTQQLVVGSGRTRTRRELAPKIGHSIGISLFPFSFFFHPLPLPHHAQHPRRQPHNHINLSHLSHQPLITSHPFSATPAQPSPAQLSLLSPSLGRYPQHRHHHHRHHHTLCHPTCTPSPAGSEQIVPHQSLTRQYELLIEENAVPAHNTSTDQKSPPLSNNKPRNNDLPAPHRKAAPLVACIKCRSSPLGASDEENEEKSQMGPDLTLAISCLQWSSRFYQTPSHGH